MDLWTLRLSAKADAVDPIYAKNTDHEYEMGGITKRPVDTALTRVARTRVGITRDGSLIQHEYKCVINPARRNTNALGTEANYSSLANMMSSRYPIHRPPKTYTDRGQDPNQLQTPIIRDSPRRSGHQRTRMIPEKP